MGLPKDPDLNFPLVQFRGAGHQWGSNTGTGTTTGGRSVAVSTTRPDWGQWRAAIEDGRATLLVGAGVSAASPSRLPLAAELVEMLTGEVISPLPLDARLSQQIVRSLRGLRLEVVADVFVECLGPRVLTPLERALRGRPGNFWHRFIATAMNRGCHVITTNFDTLIEESCDQLGIPFRIVTSPAEARNLLSRPFQGPAVLFKIHGSLSGASSRQVTSKLAIALRHVGRGLRRSMASLLSELIVARPLLVIGYSGRDDFDITPLLHFTDRRQPALWVLHDGARRSVLPLRVTERRLRAARPAVACGRAWSGTTEIVLGNSAVAYSRLRLSLLPSTTSASTPLLGSVAGSEAQSLDHRQTIRASRGRRAHAVVHALLAARDFAAALSVIDGVEAKVSLSASGRVVLLLDKATVLEQQGGDLRAARRVAALANHLANATGVPRLRAQALDRAGVVARRQGLYSRADQLYREALRLACGAKAPEGLVALIRAHRAIALGYLGHYARALAELKRTLSYEQATGDLRGVGMSLNNIGMTLSDMGKYDEALVFFADSIALKRDLGDARGIANSLHNRGKLHYRRGELDQAESDFRGSLRLRRSVGRDQHGVAQSLLALGHLAQARGAKSEARFLAQSSLRAMLAIGDDRGQVLANELLTELSEE